MRVYKFTILELNNNEIKVHDILVRGKDRNEGLSNARKQVLETKPDASCILYKCSIGHRGAYLYHPRYEERMEICRNYLQGLKSLRKEGK